MNILIVGAGAVGGYYGACLARAGLHVSYLVTPRSLPIIQKKGLIVKSKGEVWTIHPKVSTSPEELTPCDLIIIAVKRYDTESALNALQPIIKEDSVILPLQNGVDSEEDILKRFPHALVLGGIAFIGAKSEEPGVILHQGAGSLSIGELDGSESERLQTVVKMFKDAGVPAKSSRDIYKAKWQKLCWNAVFNPLTVILNGPIDYILDSKDALEIAHGLFNEIRSVAERKGIMLSADLMDEHIAVTQKLRGFHTSMYEDFVRGKSTEIDYFNGYVCREGVRLGVPVPVNGTIMSLVKAISCRPGKLS
ncbi:MAG: ketopantoate reductase family protein [Nitrospirae bacterium]|nr:ketopantoate reductase family protein [Nitrospirota bacterium]